jgi:hypothetical protein
MARRASLRSSWLLLLVVGCCRWERNTTHFWLKGTNCLGEYLALLLLLSKYIMSSDEQVDRTNNDILDNISDNRNTAAFTAMDVEPIKPSVFRYVLVAVCLDFFLESHRRNA